MYADFVNHYMGQVVESIRGFIFKLYILQNNSLPFPQIAALPQRQRVNTPPHRTKIFPARIYCWVECIKVKLLTSCCTYHFICLSFSMISCQLYFGIKKQFQGNQGEFNFCYIISIDINVFWKENTCYMTGKRKPERMGYVTLAK